MRGRPIGSALDGTRYDARAVLDEPYIPDVRHVLRSEARATNVNFLRSQIATLERTEHRSGFLSSSEQQKLRHYRRRLATFV